MPKYHTFKATMFSYWRCLSIDGAYCWPLARDECEQRLDRFTHAQTTLVTCQDPAALQERLCLLVPLTTFPENLCGETECCQSYRYRNLGIVIISIHIEGLVQDWRNSLLTHQSYRSLAQSHRYIYHSICLPGCVSQPKWMRDSRMFIQTTGV